LRYLRAAFHRRLSFFFQSNSTFSASYTNTFIGASGSDPAHHASRAHAFSNIFFFFQKRLTTSPRQKMQRVLSSVDVRTELFVCPSEYIVHVSFNKYERP